MYKFQKILQHVQDKLSFFIMVWPVLLIFGLAPLLASILSGEFMFVIPIYIICVVLWMGAMIIRYLIDKVL